MRLFDNACQHTLTRRQQEKAPTFKEARGCGGPFWFPESSLTPPERRVGAVPADIVLYVVGVPRLILYKAKGHGCTTSPIPKEKRGTRVDELLRSRYDSLTHPYVESSIVHTK